MTLFNPAPAQADLPDRYDGSCGNVRGFTHAVAIFNSRHRYLFLGAPCFLIRGVSVSILNRKSCVRLVHANLSNKKTTIGETAELEAIRSCFKRKKKYNGESEG